MEHGSVTNARDHPWQTPQCHSYLRIYDCRYGETIRKEFIKFDDEIRLVEWIFFYWPTGFRLVTLSVAIGTLLVFTTNPRSRTLGKYFLYSHFTENITHIRFCRRPFVVRCLLVSSSSHCAWPSIVIIYYYYYYYYFILLLLHLIYIFQYYIEYEYLHRHFSLFTFSAVHWIVFVFYAFALFFNRRAPQLLVFNPFAVCCDTAATQKCLLRGLLHVYYKEKCDIRSRDNDRPRLSGPVSPRFRPF